jgi:DNA helicase-2/ATP-dependent DNA helicase PcrA
MIRTHGLNPSRVWALTFSNKAANEMRHRLSLLGINGVQTGTFHSICAGLLRKHARLVGLEPNFTICDADERYEALQYSSVLF